MLPPPAFASKAPPRWRACGYTSQDGRCHVRAIVRRYRRGMLAVSVASRSEYSRRIEQFIQSGAWTDAALPLLALELPQWRVRRIIYDAAEWHCALSRRREIPDWLDQPIEACHADLSLAILSALVGVQRVSTLPAITSVPSFPRATFRTTCRSAATISRRDDDLARDPNTNLTQRSANDPGHHPLLAADDHSSRLRRIRHIRFDQSLTAVA